MITEDYVNKQIALLLREKGFDEPTLYHYNGDNKEPTHTINYDLLKNSELKEFCSAAPTLQMVIKWLREVHKVYIEIHTYFDEEPVEYNAICYKDGIYNDTLYYTTEYEDAVNNAIKYALENLI